MIRQESSTEPSLLIFRLLIQGVISEVFPEKADNFDRDTRFAYVTTGFSLPRMLQSRGTEINTGVRKR